VLLTSASRGIDIPVHARPRWEHDLASLPESESVRGEGRERERERERESERARGRGRGAAARRGDRRASASV